MTVSEFLAYEFQLVLGQQYKVMPYHNFTKKYTTPKQTPMGQINDISERAFNEYGNTIISSIRTQEITPLSLPYIYKTCTYTAEFWVPVDIEIKDENGQLIETPKFNFFSDFTRLFNAINNKTLYTPDNLYKAYITLTEPYLSSTSTENTGSYKRLVWQITGAINLFDKDLGSGEDTKVALILKDNVFDKTKVQTGKSINASGVISTTSGSNVSDFMPVIDSFVITNRTISATDYIVYFDKDKEFLSATTITSEASSYTVPNGVFYVRINVLNAYLDTCTVETLTENFFENMTQFALGSTSDAVAMPLSSTALNPQNVAIIGQQMTFYIDDYNTGKAFELVEDKAYKNTEKITPYAVLDKNKRKVRTRLYKKDVLKNDCWCVLSVQYTFDNKSGAGRYQIGLVNGGDNE